MDWASWVLLSLGAIYLLFNIKKVFYFFSGNLKYDLAFTLWIIWFVLIWVVVIIFAFFVPTYVKTAEKIVQWTFILSIVGFLVYRNTIGFKDD
jgi:hypothetical protein